MYFCVNQTSQEVSRGRTLKVQRERKRVEQVSEEGREEEDGRDVLSSML